MKLIASPLKKKEEGKKKKSAASKLRREMNDHIHHVCIDGGCSVTPFFFFKKRDFSDGFTEGKCNVAAIKCN